MINKNPSNQTLNYLSQKDPQALLLLLGYIGIEDEVEIELIWKQLYVSTWAPDRSPYWLRQKLEKRVFVNTNIVYEPNLLAKTAYLVTHNEKKEIVFIEVQNPYLPNMEETITRCVLRLWVKYKVQTKAYVLILTEKEAPEEN
jgi:hypothetical protein